MDHHYRRIRIGPQHAALAGQYVLHHRGQEGVAQIVLIKGDRPQHHSIFRNIRRHKKGDVPIGELFIPEGPPTGERYGLFSLLRHDAELGRHVGCLHLSPVRRHVNLILGASAENLIVLSTRLDSAQQQVALLVVQDRIRILRMLQQYALELGLDFGWVVLGVWELSKDGSEQIVGLLPAFLFRDLQHVSKVPLDGCFDSLVALNMFQVPDAEGHQSCRREHDGQLQRQQCSRAVCQSPHLIHSRPQNRSPSSHAKIRL